MAAFFIGLIVMLALRNFSYKILEELSPLFYIIMVLMLIGVLLFGAEINGSRRWFHVGFFYFQPVELAKIAVILFLSAILSRSNNLIGSLVSVFIIVGLVAVEPDAGSSFLFLPILLMMLIISNINTRWIMFLAPYALLTVFSVFLECYCSVRAESLVNVKNLIYPLAISIVLYIVYLEAKTINKFLKTKFAVWMIALFWMSIGAGIMGANMLKGYQKKRIISFLVPELDPLGAGYNVRQSLLAVGSGRFFGKGLFEGTQTQLGFLPVRHTDFIIASVGEELGFAGAVTMLLLLVILLWQILRIIERTEDMSGRLIAGGIFAVILTQIVMNVGVTLGILPVIGVQLPFVSYGGTGMVVFMAMIGIVLNINKKTEIIGQ
jgi:rod shape determining protein RodA